jgi:hypothetical protein
MTLLVGYDGAGWTNADTSLGSSAGNDLWQGVAASVTGTATTAYIYVADWSVATTISVAIYDGSNNLVAESATIASSAGTGLKSAAITASITQGVTYTLMALCDAGYPVWRTNANGGTYWCEDKAIGTPGSAPATFDPSGANSGGDYKPFLIYIDGTTGGGSTAKKFVTTQRRMRME